VLLLMPAAVLIVIVLGAIAVDAAVVFLGEREASSLATAAANDAATAIDDDVLRAGGGFVLDQDRARRIALAAIAGTSSDLDDLGVEVTFPTVDGETAVRVVVRGRVHHVFAQALPGADDTVAVSASATAIAEAQPP
jgi:hypothetical protein